MTDNIIPDANTLRRTPLQEKEIDDAVKEVLLQIKEEIIEAHYAGYTHVSMNIPIQFSIEGMTFRDMQRIVWCKIIQELKQKNYKVGILPRDTECVIHIEWESAEVKQEAKAQQEYLSMCTIKK